MSFENKRLGRYPLYQLGARLTRQAIKNLGQAGHLREGHEALHGFSPEIPRKAMRKPCESHEHL